MIKSLLQTDAWAAFKEGFGWRAERYNGLLGLERDLPFGKTLLYFPEVPYLEESFRTSKLPTHEKKSNRIFTRYEFLEPWTPDRASKLLSEGWVKAFEDVQPEYRQWVFLDKSEDDILKEMKPKGRYNINVAKRHQLKVDTGITDESIKTLFSLYQATSQRTGFKGRDFSYFQALATMLREHDLGEIITVSKDNQPLSALLLSFYGGIASYLYGGSGGDRSLMGPYLAHFEAIKLAKKRDCHIYDLLAVAPTEEENHIHAGLTRFKTQFGGQTVRLLGSWDLVHDRFWYTIYKLIQRRRRRAVA